MQHFPLVAIFAALNPKCIKTASIIAVAFVKGQVGAPGKIHQTN